MYSKEVPTKEGWYWFYTKRNGCWIEYLYFCDPSVLCLNVINDWNERESATLKSYLKSSNEVHWFLGPLDYPEIPHE